MSDRVRRHWETLEVLSKAKESQRGVIIGSATRDLILTLCEIIHNVLLSTVILTKHEIKKLKPYHNLLVRLADKSVPMKSKKRIIQQKGGFLTTLLPPALGVLTDLLAL